MNFQLLAKTIVLGTMEALKIARASNTDFSWLSRIQIYEPYICIDIPATDDGEQKYLSFAIMDTFSSISGMIRLEG